MAYNVYLGERLIRIVYHPETAEGKICAGEVELHRGAPSVTDHPELQHAFMSMDNPAVHAEFVRHRWTWELPNFYAGLPNYGDARRYLLLTASGGDLNWTLVLKVPPRTPNHVIARICSAFHAHPKEDSMKPADSNDATPKPASLSPSPVPKADPLPSAAKEGVKSIVQSAG